ncbi:MAG: RidA family protein [Actinomycetota bacterium]
MSYDTRATELGIVLPGPFAPHAPLLGVVVHEGVARTSGCLPRDAEGRFPATGVLGRDVTTEVGRDCARLAVLNALSLLREELGSLDALERILSVLVFVACADDFVEQPAVADGASAVLVEIFGDAGRHTRAALGVSALPRGACVEVEIVAALRSR